MSWVLGSVYGTKAFIEGADQKAIRNEMPPQVEFIPDDEIYIGYFDTHARTRNYHVIGEHDDKCQTLKINERDDFLASWSAGVNEARNGSDLHYADYNNQYAFTAGYEHWHNRNKKALKGRLTHYSTSREYLCHGFSDENTGEIWHQ